MDLNGTIRTLGFHQPYASLMLHGKIETRWVEEGRTPPFPLGKYLIYANKKEYGVTEFMSISGHFAKSAIDILEYERTLLTGIPIGVGELLKIYPYSSFDPEKIPKTYVEHTTGVKVVVVHKKNIAMNKKFILWCLEFGPIHRLKYTFDFTEGKQGVGICSAATKAKIVLMEDDIRSAGIDPIGKPLTKFYTKRENDI
jgi:hypothetical protein